MSGLVSVFSLPALTFWKKEAKIKMGALDYLSNFCTIPITKTEHKAMQTVEIKVKMDCDGCERKVRNAVTSMKGFITRPQDQLTLPFCFVAPSLGQQVLYDKP